MLNAELGRAVGESQKTSVSDTTQDLTEAHVACSQMLTKPSSYRRVVRFSHGADAFDGGRTLASTWITPVGFRMEMCPSTLSPVPYTGVCAPSSWPFRVMLTPCSYAIILPVGLLFEICCFCSFGEHQQERANGMSTQIRTAERVEYVFALGRFLTSSETFGLSSFCLFARWMERGVEMCSIANTFAYG